MKLKIIGLLLLLGMASSVVAQSNVLLLCVDDLRPELASFGAEYIHSPNIDRLAAEGRAFHRHYVNAPSFGPSRYAMLTGSFGPRVNGNQQLFMRSEKISETPEEVMPSMPEWFRGKGYTTVSVGKVSHAPGGRGGTQWNDESIIEMPGAWDRHLMPVGEWENPKRAMHGLVNGVGKGAFMGRKDLFQSADGDDTIYPDGLILEEGLKQLNQLAAAEKPFFLAVGFIRPHLPFGAPAKYMRFYDGVEIPAPEHTQKPEGTTTWHISGGSRLRRLLEDYYLVMIPLSFPEHSRWSEHNLD